MNMKVLKNEKKLCTCCMEEHEVRTVLVKEQAAFKNTKVQYEAVYLYCDMADELYMDEKMMQENDIRLKDAYRKSEGLLTSEQIRGIREKYGISQQDLCILLGWGGKTITRYESHQVQDKAHDTILKKLDYDPEWFLALLDGSRDLLTGESYRKYRNNAAVLYEQQQDSYLRKSIKASYARFHDHPLWNGNTQLSLDKVVDIIRYFAAAAQVTALYKVKLMKMLWYADALSYKRRGFAITGLVYQALPLGAVPVGHNSIIALQGIPCEERDMGESGAYHFILKEAVSFPALTQEDRKILDRVIEKVGKMTKNEIVSYMHEEMSYKKTAPREVISFEYAKYLQIS